MKPLNMIEERNLTLDLWEVANDFGTTPVSPRVWATRYHSKIKPESAARRWSRFLSRVRRSSWPVAFVEVDGANHGHANDRKATPSKALGIQLWSGARKDLGDVLDAHAGIEA